MKTWFLYLSLLLAGSTYAYDGASSELSHMVGGALLAGALTRAYSDSENHAWIGFSVSSAASLIAEGVQASRAAKSSSSLLDFASHTTGAALGAWMTDRYLLAPVITRSYVAVVYWRSF